MVMGVAHLHPILSSTCSFLADPITTFTPAS